MGQENHTKGSHIRVPGLVDQEALQSPGAQCHEEGCRPPERSTHRGRAAAEHSSEWGRGMDALTVLTCLNNTVPALVCVGSAFSGSH